MLAVIAIGAGLLIGLTLGALGGGGSILTVPALVYLLGESAHQATSTSLLVVGAAAVAGMATHARAGRVRFREGAAFGALGIAGSYAGSLASAGVPARVLLAGFGVLMFAVAALMIARRGATPARSRWWLREASLSQPAGERRRSPARSRRNCLPGQCGWPRLRPRWHRIRPPGPGPGETRW